MFNLPNLSAKNRLLAGASFATLLIAAPAAHATTLGGMTGRNAAQINMTTPPPRPAGFGGATTPDQAKQATSQSSADFSTALARIQAQMSAQATARSAAIAGPNNLGADPNHPGQQLPDVPNGLGAGGLVAHANPSAADTANGLVWENANAPTQSTSGAQTTVTVQQNAQKAILTWDSFNVGKNTTVHFDQTKGTQSDGSNTWIALNRIVDPSDRPSQILGNITAEGSVYLINRNGIIFGGSSQVNMHSLVASALPIFQEGNRATADANELFRTTGIGDPDPTIGTTFGSQSVNVSSGDVTIEAGAQIETGENGFSFFTANNVSNAGNIVANGGQAILAASTGVRFGVNPQVYGYGNFPNYTVINTGTITGLRGDVTLTGTSVEQRGVVLTTTSISRPGTITISGDDQGGSRGGLILMGSGSLTTILPDGNGETTSSTPAADSIFKPGSATIQGGSIVFQSGSLALMPGGDLTVHVLEGNTPVPPDVVGGRIYIDSGATLSVAGLSDVQLPMSDNLVTVPRVGLNELADSPLQQDGIVYRSPFTVDARDSGTRDDGLAWIGTPLLNASGYVQGVPRTVNQLLVNGGSITLQNDEFGGTITAPGSRIDISGGYIDYQAGLVQTTRLVGADGRIYDAASADPMMTYVGLAGVQTVTHDRWAVSETYTNSLFSGAVLESAYISGGNGGSLTIGGAGSNILATVSGAPLILDGQIDAHALSGRYQVGGGKETPGGSFSIAGRGFHLTADGIDFADLGDDFGVGTSLATPERLAQETSDISNLLYTNNLSTRTLNDAGFSSVSFAADMITLDSDASLTVEPGGSIALTAGRMDIFGNLTAHAGKISLTGTGLTGSQGLSAFGPAPGSSPVLQPPTGEAPVAGDITLGSNTLLDVSGLWVNDRGRFGDDQTGSSFINGGAINIQTNATAQMGWSSRSVTDGNAYDTTGAIIVPKGAMLDASGGGYVDALGQVATKDGIPLGQGGDISLRTYVGSGWYMGDLLNPGGLVGAPPTHGTVQLDGTLKGYGFSGGGTLTLQTLGIQIGGDSAGLPAYITWLPEDYFADQGFGGYNVTALYDATIAPGAQVHVSQRNYIANPLALAGLESGTDLSTAGAVSLGVLDPYHRQATDFSLTGAGYLTWNGSTIRAPKNARPDLDGVSGTLLVDEGASILADAGANVTLTSYGQLTDLGSITAHGGSATLQAYDVDGLNYDFLSRSVWLGAESSIDVSGTTLIDPLAQPVRSGFGLVVPHNGKVLAGGSVVIDGGNAYVVAKKGSQIDVSGADAVLDIASASGGGLSGSIVYRPADVWSDAGNIRLGSSSGLYYDGTIAGHGGNAQARGGTLSLYEVFNQNNSGILSTPTAIGLLLQQSGDLVTDAMQAGGRIESGTAVSGVMHFAADRLNGSGINTLLLGGSDPTELGATLPTIAFAGDVTLSVDRAVMLTATNFMALAAGSTGIPAVRTLGALTGGGHVEIDAPYVALAGGGVTNFTPVLPTGDATLAVRADMIDLMGQFQLQRFSDANFTSSGDIRLYNPDYLAYIGATTTPRPGELITSGNLTFQAAQLYPATGSVFLLDAPTANSTITFLGNGNTAAPLSVGGALLVDAATIVQDGTLRAPSGTIQLGVGDVTDADIKTAFNNLPLIRTTSVTLGDGGLTSVSLDGQSLPYGTTTDGTDWKLSVTNLTGQQITSSDLTQAPQKLVSLAGDTVTLGTGAVIDLSGGGNIYAQEWVPGTGGSRDLLNAVNTSYSSGALAQQVPLYPDGRPVYAVVPGKQSPVAAYDPSFGYPGSEIGKSVYLSGVKGLADGVYTLLPGQYATLPGAFRVVQNTAAQDSVSSNNTTLADGSQIVAGRFVDGISGKSDARSTSFLVQSTDTGVWQQYSEYTLTPADTYFPAQAAHAGSTATRTPVDAGRLALAAVDALVLDGQLKATAGDKGRGAQVDISGQDIQIVGDNATVRDGYLQIDATSLSKLGAESILIGGTRADGVDGTTITANADSVILSNDADSALTGPEIMLVTRAGTSADAANGLLLEAGSVIAAKGDIANASTLPILIGATGGASGDGALLRVSNGGPVAVIRANVPGQDGVAGTPHGLLDIRDGASIDGGKSAILDSSADLLLDPGAVFAGDTVDVNANSIAFVAANGSAPTNGFVVGPHLLTQLANIQTLGLHSRTTMGFYGDVDLVTGNSLTLGANAFTGDGGTVTITAPNLILTNDIGGSTATFVAGSGALTLNVDELDFGAGIVTTQGFGRINATANKGIVGQGNGNFDFGTLDVAMTAPVFLADNGANTKITTTGALSLNRGAGTAIDRETLGGALNFSGGSITTNATIQAVAGNLTLDTTSGDLTVADGANLSVAGVSKTFYDTDAYAPAGTLTLTANTGAIDIATNATLDFSGADKGGDAGGLTVSAEGAVTLDGQLNGHAADGYRGGRFTLTSGAAIDLDRIADLSTASGSTGGLSVTSGAGNLVLSQGKTIKAQIIYLSANGGSHPSTSDGNVIVNGTLDVSGEAAGHIDLYGSSGVDVEGSLLAVSSVPEQDGGVVSIGTGGATDGGLDHQYGYETVQAGDSGTIRIGAQALIDVSGGSADSGGQVSFRSPLLVGGDVAITVGGTIKGARSVTIEPYAVWSTTDASSGAQHFDGIIDPAGWYNADGTMVAGEWTDDQGVVQDAPVDAAALKNYLTNYYFTPDAANPDHVSFYGYNGGDAANGPGTLMGFVEQPGFAFSNDYSGIANLHVRPGMELRNPGDTVRGGDIAILTNWNLGAGTQDPSTGAITLAYRYGVEAPILTVRAEHNLDIQASITDGFFQQNSGAAIQDPVVPPLPNQAYVDALAAYTASKAFLDANDLWNGTVTLISGGNPIDITGDPNYQPVQAPRTGQTDAYYANYMAYIGEIGVGNGDNMWADWQWVAKISGIADYAPNGNPGGDTLKSPADFSTYADYQSYYENWLETWFNLFGGITDSTPIPLQAPIDSSYAAYSANYQGIYIPGHQTYMFQLLFSDFDLSTGADQLVYAPFAPLMNPDTSGGGPVQVRVPVDPSHANNSPSNMPIAGSPVSLASATLLGGNSSSYRLVAGADFTAPDPLALHTQTSSGSVNIDGHFAVIDTSTTNADGSVIDPRQELAGRTLDLPTVIRTGTGDIDIAAADDLNLLDHVAPGAIYAAGAPVPGTTAGTGVSVLRNTDGSLERVPLLLINDPVQATGAGNITLTTGGDINAVEQVYDTDGSRTGKAGTFLGQYWWPWMNTDYVTELTNGVRSLTETSLAFGAFDQGVMSVGGNVAVYAGGDIRELSISLPSTFYTSGGARQFVDGGGNVDVVAGGDVLGGAYFISKGTGRIDAGGSVGPDFTITDTFGVVSPVSTILALQDATWAVAARGDLNIGNIMNPVTLTGIPGGDVDYSDRSTVDLTSTVGDVSILTMAATTSLYSYAGSFSPSKSLPATIAMTALDGGVTVASSGILFPAADGNLTILADKDVHFVQTQNNTTQQPFTDFASFGLSDAIASQPLSFGSGEADANTASTQRLVDGLLHADDDQPVRIYSLTGDIVSGEMVDGLQVNSLRIVSPKPAQIRAAGDIVNLTFQGQNLHDSDVTSIIAGRDIYDVQPLTGTLPVQQNAIYIQPGLIQVGGPGSLDIQAGRDLGPLHGNYVTSEGGATPATGIQTVGNLFNPFLPRESADISVLFGVGPGVAWDSFANLYVNPAANLPGIPSVTTQLIDSVAQYEADQDARSGGKGSKPNLTADEAWAIFQTLPEAQREAVIQTAFFQVLAITGVDYNDPTSPYFGKYNRGYQAINDLFPAALGYTSNNLEGGENGAATRVTTGNLDIRGTTIQTRQGGDVNIMGPGGQLLIGSASAPPYLPPVGNSPGLGPEAFGILALQTGAVNIFSDDSLLLAQSRIFTEQGGNMTIWSSNGDINAGKGAKTSSEIGSVLFDCDTTFYCYVDAASQVTGAGIAAFPAKPGTPSPVVTLVAPRGTVDAGDAGIRVSGDLFIAAQAVANADNIQVSGKAIGLPPKPVTNLALTTASTAATEAAQLVHDIARQQPNLAVSVEVTGFGGQPNQPEECVPGVGRSCDN